MANEQASAAARYTLHGDSRSGNCWKVAVMLHMSGLPFTWRPVDVLSGVTRLPEFLALNPNGKVPLLLLPDGRPLAESNAMLLHLSEGTDLMPDERYDRALVYQWLFFEQYSHEPYIAVARFLRHFDHGMEVPEERMAALHEQGGRALRVMDGWLERHAFFAGARFTVADIALFAYTHVAADGGFDLTAYPAVNAWLERCRRQPGFKDLAAMAEWLAD